MAGLGGTIPNFDGLLDSDQPKDTEVTIVEEGSPTAPSSKKRSRQGTPDNHITVQAHWVVLRSLSPYFQAKLERWSRDGNASKKPCRGRQQQQQQQQQQEQPPAPYQYSLQLLVPPGQLELGRRLITAMYSSSPDLSDLEAPQLMQLVTLAECYGVGKVVSDAAAQLHKSSVGSMPLDVAASVFELPEACLELEAVKKVQQAAADKLQQELGDLEVVWGDEAKQQQVLGLPFGGLLQLLRDERTRVASEDTAVYTAQRWLQTAGSSNLKQQQQQLALVLRPQHCTATYLASMAAYADMGWVYDDKPVLLMDLLCVAGRSGNEQKGWMRTFAADKEAWGLPQRPSSAVVQVNLSWDVPLKDIEERLAAAAGACANMKSPAEIVWQGRRWSLTLEYETGSRFLDGFVWCRIAPAYVTASITLDLTSQTAHIARRVILDKDFLCSDGGQGGEVAQWGPGKEEWPAVKAWLQQQGLVHPDGCLHLRATVTRVT